MLKSVRIILALALTITAAHAGVLPEDRADIMYHRYEGGGVTIDGPSLLIRKSMLDDLSVSFNHYVDNVTSASIDVQVYASGASVYSEQRKENAVGLTYLHNNTTINFGYTNSEESDYSAETASFAISQDFFGALSNLSLSFAQGDDVVRMNNREGGVITSTDDIGTVDRNNYRIAFSQVATKNLVFNATLETITDQGFLNNPYRKIRYLDSDGITQKDAPEQYPETRTSDAFALRANYFWPWWRAALKFEARTFTDTWGIKGKTFEIKYTHPFDDAWIFEGKVRQYDQTAADFYRDLFPYENFQNFMARDKEMSSYSTFGFGAAATYEWKNIDFSFIERMTLSLYADFVRYQYDDFHDARESRNGGAFAAGNEPLYEYDAVVTRLIFSVYY